MPIGIILYEIDETFGPSIISEYYLSKTDFTKDVLKELTEKHTSKNLVDATVPKEDYKYFSSKISSEKTSKNYYLGFVLREEEDLVSLKSMFESVEQNIKENLDEIDRNKMKGLLKEMLNSILGVLEKLKEPRIIQETINEKTKKMLDEGKLQEARELIDLGEEIPEELASLVREADEYFNEQSYKKAKKRFLKAADLAKQIQEEQIVDFLRNKAEKVGNFPDLIKEKENLEDNIKDIFEEFESNQLRLYSDLVDPMNRLIKITNNFEDEQRYNLLNTLMKDIKKASSLAKDLYKIDKRIEQQMKEL